MSTLELWNSPCLNLANLTVDQNHMRLRNYNLEITESGKLKLDLTTFLDLNCLTSPSVLETKPNLLFFNEITRSHWGNTKKLQSNIKKNETRFKKSKNESRILKKKSRNRKSKKNKSKSKRELERLEKVKLDVETNEIEEEGFEELKEGVNRMRVEKLEFFETRSLEIMLFRNVKSNQDHLVCFDIMVFDLDASENEHNLTSKTIQKTRRVPEIRYYAWKLSSRAQYMHYSLELSLNKIVIL